MHPLMEELARALQLPLIYNALIVGVLVSLCAAMLGVVLVLKRYALIGHGLGEVGFAAMSLAMLLGISDNPLPIAVPLVAVASMFIMWLSQTGAMGGDVAIGVIATAGMAAGVLMSSLSTGFSKDVSGYMFGSLYGMTDQDVYLSIGLAVLVIALFALLFNRLFAVTYDEVNARATGLNVKFYQFLISFLTAVTVVLGMRMLGALLISSLIIFPALIAKRLVGSFRAMVVVAALVSVACFLTGMCLSFFLNLPLGASVVAIDLALLLLVSIVGKARGR